MYRITVTQNGAVSAVYFNKNREQGLANAKMEHSSKCKFIVEEV